MNVPVSTPTQLQTVLRAMRASRGWSQEELGRKIGVSQRRIAAIEAAPGRASFDQLARIISILGGQLSVAEVAVVPVPKQKASKKTSRSENADW